MNKKGFTMIELLSTITLLGILTVMAVVAYTKYVDKVRMTTYKNYEESLKDAATSYFLNHTGLLPQKGSSDGTKVTAKTLIDEGYLENMKDPKNKKGTCNDNSFVRVTRKNDVGFNMDLEYKSCVVCGKYMSNSCANAACKVIVTSNSTGNNGWYRSNTVNYKLELYGDYTSYGVSNNGYRLNNNLIGSVTGEGVHTVYGIVKDAATKDTLTCSKKINIDTTPPTCTYRGGNTRWTKENVRFTRVCQDSLSGCEITNMSIGVTKTVKTYTVSSIPINDKAGNVAICPATNIDVYIDKNKPTISINADRNYRGNLCPDNPGHVYKYHYNVKLADEHSGLKTTKCYYGNVNILRNIAGSSEADKVLKANQAGITENLCGDTESGITCTACDQAGNCYTKSVK